MDKADKASFTITNRGYYEALKKSLNAEYKEKVQEASEKAYKKGLKEGLRKGFLRATAIASIAAFVIFMNHQLHRASLEAFKEPYDYLLKNSHSYDVGTMIGLYDPEDPEEDLDLYLYGCWKGFHDLSEEGRISRMNVIIRTLHDKHIIEYEDFYDYLSSRRLLLEEDGEKKVDPRYEKALKDYYDNYRRRIESQEREKLYEDAIERFKNGEDEGKSI